MPESHQPCKGCPEALWAHTRWLCLENDSLAGVEVLELLHPRAATWLHIVPSKSSLDHITGCWSLWHRTWGLHSIHAQYIYNTYWHIYTYIYIVKNMLQDAASIKSYCFTAFNRFLPALKKPCCRTAAWATVDASRGTLHVFDTPKCLKQTSFFCTSSSGKSRATSGVSNS